MELVAPPVNSHRVGFPVAWSPKQPKMPKLNTRTFHKAGSPAESDLLIDGSAIPSLSASPSR